MVRIPIPYFGAETNAFKLGRTILRRGLTCVYPTPGFIRRYLPKDLPYRYSFLRRSDNERRPSSCNTTESVLPMLSEEAVARLCRSQSSPDSREARYPPSEARHPLRKHLAASIISAPICIALSVALHSAQNPTPTDFSGIIRASYSSNPLSHSSIIVGGRIISASTNKTPLEEAFCSPMFLAPLLLALDWITVAPFVSANSTRPS